MPHVPHWGPTDKHLCHCLPTTPSGRPRPVDENGDLQKGARKLTTPRKAATLAPRRIITKVNGTPTADPRKGMRTASSRMQGQAPNGSGANGNAMTGGLLVACLHWTMCWHAACTSGFVSVIRLAPVRAWVYTWPLFPMRHPCMQFQAAMYFYKPAAYTMMDV